MGGSAYPAIGQMGKYWELGEVQTTTGKLSVRRIEISNVLDVKIELKIYHFRAYSTAYLCRKLYQWARQYCLPYPSSHLNISETD